MPNFPSRLQSFFAKQVIHGPLLSVSQDLVGPLNLVKVPFSRLLAGWVLVPIGMVRDGERSVPLPYFGIAGASR